MKTLLLVFTSMREYKVYNIVIGIQLLFCITLMSYVFTNAEKYKRYEDLYQTVAQENAWYICKEGTEKVDLQQEYHKISAIFPEKQIGMLANGYVQKKKCYFINSSMKNYYKPKLKSGRWFSKGETDCYEAVVGETISKDYPLNQTYQLDLFDEETQKSYQISIKVVGILERRCLVWKFDANFFEGMLEDNFGGFLINLENTEDSGLMKVLDLNGFMVKNDRQEETDEKMESEVGHHIFSLYVLYQQYENEVKTEKGISELFLLLVMLLTVVGSNGLLLLLVNKKKQQYAIYMQSGSTMGKCIGLEFLHIAFLMVAVMACFSVFLTILHQVIEVDLYWSLYCIVQSFLICVGIYMISYSIVLTTLLNGNLKYIFSGNEG